MYQRGIVGAIASFIILLLLQSILVRIARRKAQKSGSGFQVKFWDILVTSEDGCYSLSRLQMYLWTYAIVIGFMSVLIQFWTPPDIPDTLYLLMGVNLASTVASTAINTARDEKKTCGQPDFWKDIFFEKKESLDLPRSQMFLWTIISRFVFFIKLYHSFPGMNINNVNSIILPDIPTGLVVLMGISHGAYLGAKAASKKENG